jgi:hypothetical protein
VSWQDDFTQQQDPQHDQFQHHQVQHHDLHVTGYEITLADGTVEHVDCADAYAQEGPLTTFFDTAGRDVIDSWASRVLSLRTTEILMVRRTARRQPSAQQSVVMAAAALPQAV